ncbi:MAG: PAS domain S-box protein [Deltaproteobacteria bacterium]|nr:PAS domain S-box protein [Deltaproteobacteria bacterium]
MRDDKQAEERLRVSEERFRSLITNSPDFIYIANADGIVTFINRTLPQHTEEDIVGKTIYDFALPEYHDIMRKAIAEVFDTGQANRYDTKAPGPDNSISYYETRCLPLMRGGKVDSFIGVSTDITDRRRAEEALRRSEEKWRSLAENAPVMITHVDCEGLIKSINRVPEGIGLTEDDILGKNSIDFTKEQYRDIAREVYARVLETGISESYETRGALTDKWYHSTVGALRENDKIIGLTVINVDITDRKEADEERLRLERQVQQAQKMESLGVLAGGVAHDFNNLLMGVVGNADLALLRMTPESPGRKNIYDIQTAAERAADLARQMLAYSGKGKFIVKRMELQNLVKEMVHLLEMSISKKAAIIYDFTQDVPQVEADPTQLRQIIMNLVINASEAIDDRSGVISIRTGVMECDRPYLDETYLDNDLPEGVYSYFEVSDTGSGMDKETIGKLFDPFFTTKFTGRGLGLAAVLGIVRSHKGTIRVCSEPGKGSTFKVLFPAKKGLLAMPAEGLPVSSKSRTESPG